MDSANKEGAGTSNKTKFLLMFQMMQEQQRQYQEAAERRFKLELEEIRQRAKEERYDMLRFMAALQLKGGKTSSSCSSPEAVQLKFRRLDDEALNLIQGLRSRRENYRPFHEIEVMVKAVEGAVNDLRSFVCEKVDQLEEEMREPILSDLKHTKELCFSELLVANSYISELKALHEEEKLVRVGFDSFSQKSFVTKKVVDDLEIDSTRTDFLNIEGFGGSSNIHHMNLVRFLLCPIESESREKLHVEAHVQNG